MVEADHLPGAEPLLAIGGRYVAFEEERCFGGDRGSDVSCYVRIIVHDATRGRSWETQLPDLGGKREVAYVESVAVTARGWVAWEEYHSSTETMQVWTMPPRGKSQKIAEGPATAISGETNDSLAVSFDRLYWQFGDVPGSMLLR